MTGSQDHCARTPDASLYVLGELRGRQQESFARHLHRCEECAEEVDLLQQVAEAVPLLASSRHLPAPDEESRPEQWVPSLTVAASSTRSAALGNARALAAGASDAVHQKPAGRPVLRPIEGGAGGAPRPSVSSRRLLKTPMPKPALIGLVALAVLAIATVAISRRAASTHFVRIQAGWSPGGAALKLQGNDLELMVVGMPKPARGTGYQVWVLDRLEGGLTPTTAWLHPNRLGEDGVTVPGDYHNWLAVTVYTEPLRGPHTIRSGAAVVGDLRSVR